MKKRVLSISCIVLVAIAFSFALTACFLRNNTEDEQQQLLNNGPKLEFTLNEEGNYDLSGCKALMGSNIEIPSEYNGKPVTGIRSEAFDNCSDINSIKIPSSIKWIEEDAFVTARVNDAVYIENLEAWLNTELEDFSSCPILYNANIYFGDEKLSDEIVIPSTTKEIKAYTLSGFRGTTVKIEEGVERIGDGAFYNCGNLTTINIPASLKSCGSGAFGMCKKITNVYFADFDSWLEADFQSNPASLSKNVYLDGKIVSSLKIPEGVETIKSNTFAGIDSISSIEFPSTLKEIEQYAFSGCNGLTTIKLPEGLLKIGYRVFADCKELRSITLPQTLTVVGDWAFFGCEKLSEVKISDLAAFCNIDFGSVHSLFDYRAALKYTNGEVISELIIPDGITEIKDYAFMGTNFRKIVLPEGVVSVGYMAFQGCSASEITLPGSLQEIGSYAFRDCLTLFDLKFNGTMQQWNAVSKGIEWDSGMVYRVIYQ